MSKKYLSLEEAAHKIGINTEELNRLREKGTIRAFADRGTWKFKEDDVDVLVRSRQADSDPDVPLQFAADEDSRPELTFSDDDASGEPTVIGKGLEDSSDSDVRLIFDDGANMPAGTGAGDGEDSDSDVKLAGSTAKRAEAGSDSDVKLVGEEDTTDAGGSDSDVRLISGDSSGEVKLAERGRPGEPDSAKYSGETEEDESGISLADDSGISLVSDSGISLEQPRGSGVSIASDSGISLERPNDSGISLSEESSIVAGGDSGISLAPDAPRKSGKKPKSPADSGDLTGTIPLMDLAGSDSEDVLDTQTEVPMLDSADAPSMGGGTGETTSVITLDEDEDEYAVAGNKSKPGDSEDDLFGGDAEVAVEEGEEVDVTDEVAGEDDELGEDVFGAEDEDFSEQVESGESVAELPISRGMAAPVEQDWGTGAFVGLTISAILMVACGTVLFDMVRNMWHTDAASQNPVASMLLDAFRNM